LDFPFNAFNKAWPATSAYVKDLQKFLPPYYLLSSSKATCISLKTTLELVRNATIEVRN
jgi:hypothetical protein